MSNPPAIAWSECWDSHSVSRSDKIEQNAFPVVRVETNLGLKTRSSPHFNYISLKEIKILIPCISILLTSKMKCFVIMAEHCQWFCGAMVSTLDSESTDLSSNLSTTFIISEWWQSRNDHNSRFTFEKQSRPNLQKENKNNT